MSSRASQLALLLLLTASSLLARPNREAVDDYVRIGKAELGAAAIGTSGAAQRALEAFDAALAADPSHARARAGHGLALIATAITAPMSEKLRLAQAGCADLDAAVDAAPDDAAIRLMRAQSAMQMPLILERATVAEADFAILLAIARDERTDIAPAIRRGIFYQAAAFALKERRPGAVELLEMALSIRATEPSDEQVQSMLALARRQLTSISHADRHTTDETSAPGP